MLGLTRALFMVFLFVCPAALAADALSPAVRVVIAPVRGAYELVERKHAALPSPKSDAERLIRLGEIDQTARESFGKIDLSVLPPDQRAAAYSAAWDEINRHDLANQSALKAMLPPEGWFSMSRYGARAVYAAFLIVQHAVNDRALQHTVLEAMEPLLAKREIDSQAYALLYDRVQIHDGKPQLYGTQLTCKDGKWILDTQADPDHVNERRKAMGFALTLEQNVARFANRPPCN